MKPKVFYQPSTNELLIAMLLMVAVEVHWNEKHDEHYSVPRMKIDYQPVGWAMYDERGLVGMITLSGMREARWMIEIGVLQNDRRRNKEIQRRLESAGMKPVGEYMCNLDMEDDGFWQGQIYLCFGDLEEDTLKMKSEMGFIVEVPKVNFERVE